MSESVKAFLKAKEPMVNPKDRAKTSFILNKSNYEKFKILCQQRDVKPSRLIDLFIADTVREFFKS